MSKFEEWLRNKLSVPGIRLEHVDMTNMYSNSGRDPLIILSSKIVRVNEQDMPLNYLWDVETIQVEQGFTSNKFKSICENLMVSNSAYIGNSLALKRELKKS